MTINIPLIDNWRILSDSHQFILAREVGDKILHEGFFMDLESLIKYFISMKIRGFNATSTVGLINSIKSLQNRLFEALPLLDKQKSKPHPPKNKDIPKNEKEKKS